MVASQLRGLELIWQIGYTLNLQGTGIDALGRKGNQGRVDNKFRERFSNAILRSALNIALANALDSVVKPQISSQTAANQVSSNVKNIANGIFTQAGLTDATKRVQICAAAQSAITDKTSTTFTQIQTACTSLAADPTATDAAKLTSLMSTINSSSDALIQNTRANVEETKAQEASKQAFTDISDTIKTLVEEQEFKPTITIDQGTPVKIYVNKDYKFPKAAVSKSRVVK
jgi:type IV secretion system protein VirB10